MMIIFWFKNSYLPHKVALNFCLVWGHKCRMWYGLGPFVVTLIALIPWKKNLEYVQLKLFTNASWLVNLMNSQVKFRKESSVLFILQCHCHFNIFHK